MSRLTSLKPIADRLLRSGHVPALSLVAVGCLIGQTAILTRHPLTFQLADSPSYIALGSRLATHPSLANLLDAYRTPGYPAFLAVLASIQNSIAGDGVVFAQAMLLVLTAFELYALTFGISGSRVAAVIVGFLFASNVRLLDWERLIMTESVAIFLVTTTVLAFWLWLRYRATGWAVVFCVASILCVMTRPSLVYLPVCLAMVVLAGDRRRWLAVLAACAAIYLPVLGYSIANDRVNPNSGLSAVSNINLLGKVLEYGMQNEGDSSRYPVLWQGISSLAPGDKDPYNILKANPAALGANYWDAAGFSRDIIVRHPLEYFAKSSGDLVQQWLAVPYAYVPSGGYQWLTQLLADYALLAYTAYPALPLAAAALVVLWRRIDRTVALGIAGVMVAVVGSLVTTALFSYLDFARLRTPVDALAFVAVIAMSAQIYAQIAGVDRKAEELS